ncbi:hypothetical protein OQA88_4024 [Cercophora sp. LCS_1]
MSTVLETLPPRPPTPPREARHEGPLVPRLVLGTVELQPNVHTPPGNQSPGESITTNSTTRRSRKKVEFSAKAEYKEAPVLLEGDTKPHPTPVSLPRSASKPVKSILKVTQYPPNPLSPADGSIDASNSDVRLVEMLESTIQQLAGGDRDSRVDAYTMLARACKTSDNLPDRVALQKKMDLFMQFVQRDIVAKPQEGSADLSLHNHALNLLVTFLGFPAIASSINNDFGVFIIDHCIRTFGDASTPKDVARQLLKVIHIQNFSPKVMTPDRVGRLISALHNIKVQGKSISMSRILIYRKLIKQCIKLMIVHSDWLYDLFPDMLSSLTDMRVAAISLGLEAAFSIGRQKDHVKAHGRKVWDVMNKIFEEKRYIELYHEKLRTMAKTKTESGFVPNIWSAVILLLRIPLHTWDGAKPWLEIIQSCFNSPDPATKMNANRAWSRVFYLMHSECPPFAKRLPMLTTPLIMQLQKSRPGKIMTDELRNTIFGVICSLFYYSFEPNTAPGLLDSHWDGSVKAIFSMLLDTKTAAPPDNIRKACLMLAGLFDCRTARRPWREDHISENPLVKAEDLPVIDSKWIRCNPHRVFSVVGPLLEKDFIRLADDRSEIFRVWQALVTSVASAASKEIKVSKETTTFVVEALDVLQRIWERGQPSDQARPVEFLEASSNFLETLISSLGHLPFTEKPGKTQALVRAPLYVLFITLSTLPAGIPDDDNLARFFTSIFTPFFNSKGNKTKMDLAQDLLATIPMESPRPYGPWLLVSDKILAWLGPSHSSHQSTASGVGTPVGNSYRDIVRVLERGIRSTPNLPWEHWETLFSALSERVRDETGDAGFAHLASEPLAKVLLDQFAVDEAEVFSPFNIKCVTELLSFSTQPRDRQASDAARRRLWGTALAGGRSASFDPFDYLHKAVNQVLERLYEEYKANDWAIARLLKELGGFFERGNRQLFLRTLLGLQDGFLPWVLDANRVLTNQNDPAFIASKSLWDKLATIIMEVGEPEQQIEFLDRFFCASFDSSHRHFVNAGVSLWNRLFEHAEHLQYSERLKLAISRLQPHVDMVLPGLEFPHGSGTGQGPMFVDSFDSFGHLSFPSARSSRKETPRATSPHRKPPMSGSTSAASKRHPEPTPKTKSTDTKRRPTTPRLKQDDSQVHFAPIETSPLIRNEESQVLTERQREVRERQKENAALFPEIVSSPGLNRKEGIPEIQQQGALPETSSQTREAATPEPEGVFDSYVSSTPTPRRGQPAIIIEHDKDELPSSPPEPRGNPLAAEIRSRSASNSLLDEWQFSSSPISGSPNLDRHNATIEASDLDDPPLADEASLLRAVEDSPSPIADDDVEIEDAGADVDEDDEMIEDTILPDLPQPLQTELSKTPAMPAPSTPRRQTRSMNVEETPKSDKDVFVDAPTSPLPPTPKRLEQTPKRTTRASRLKQSETVDPRSPSLGPSDGEDGLPVLPAGVRASSKVIVELDSGRVDSSDYIRPSASPEKLVAQASMLECIVVGEKPKKSGKKKGSKSSKASSVGSSVPAAPVPSTDMTESTSSSRPSSRPSSQEGRSKRKRESSKMHESGSRKRRHFTPILDLEDRSEVPDSQPSSGVKGTTPSRILNMREHKSSLAGSETERNESFEERVSSSFIDEEDFADHFDLKSSQKHDIEAQIQIELESRSQIDQQSQQQVEETSSVEHMEVDAEELAAEGQGNVEEQDTPRPPPTYVQKFITMLRSGAELLMAAPRLTQQEEWEAEDALLEVQRALHAAKRRRRE